VQALSHRSGHRGLHFKKSKIVQFFFWTLMSAPSIRLLRARVRNLQKGDLNVQMNRFRVLRPEFRNALVDSSINSLRLAIEALVPHSVIILSAHSTSDTKMAGLPNLAPH
jgi:hypothetical protein